MDTHTPVLNVHTTERSECLSTSSTTILFTGDKKKLAIGIDKLIATGTSSVHFVVPIQLFSKNYDMQCCFIFPETSLATGRIHAEAHFAHAAFITGWLRNEHMSHLDIYNEKMLDLAQ